VTGYSALGDARGAAVLDTSQDERSEAKGTFIWGQVASWLRSLPVLIILAILPLFIVVTLFLPRIFTGKSIFHLVDYVQADKAPERADMVLALVNASLVFIQMLGAALVVFTLYSAVQTMRHADANIRISQEQLEISRDQIKVSNTAQIGERYSRAVEQLNATEQYEKEIVDERGERRIVPVSRKLMKTRIGAILSLEMIARDSREDYFTVMETLTAYVRDSQYLEYTTYDPNQKRMEGDFELILAVLGRRRAEWIEAQAKPLNLRHVRLNLAKLADADMRKVDFEEAHFIGADFRETDLRGVRLRSTELRGAKFHNADLRGACLCGADLTDAIGLTQQQLDTTYMDDATILPINPATDRQFFSSWTRHQH
jgi:hypothetical protein